ncbi:hypothetical protein J0910_07460 [Nocardiopsis sp. CNT-189]|uniref:hypothetical protein n=1 Tax=Nocardiopsis oceanisediminis TaxID=2816862 RepID=UPI003B38D186
MTDNVPTLDGIWNQGWQSAVALREALLGGEPLPEMPYVPVRLEPGEKAHAAVVLDYSRYYGMDVSYQQNSNFYFGSPLFVATGLAADAIGNASARGRAEAMARAQWREFQQVTVYVTSTRLLALVEGTRWLSWYHQGSIQVHTLLGEWAVVQMFPDCEPVRWQGPAAPWLAVLLVYLVFGEDNLRHHPELSALGPAFG